MCNQEKEKEKKREMCTTDETKEYQGNFVNFSTVEW